MQIWLTLRLFIFKMQNSSLNPGILNQGLWVLGPDNQFLKVTGDFYVVFLGSF